MDGEIDKWTLWGMRTCIRGCWTRLHRVHSVTRLYSVSLKPYFPHTIKIPTQFRNGDWETSIQHAFQCPFLFCSKIKRGRCSKLLWTSSYTMDAIRAPVQNTTQIVHFYVRPVISRRWWGPVFVPISNRFNELNERFRTALPRHVGRTPALLSPRRHPLSLRAANYGASSTWEERRKHAWRP